jgi:molybdate transport system substrate-binding protein
MSRRASTVAAVLALWSGNAQAAPVTVMISGGLNTAYRALAPRFETESGDTLVTVEGASMGANPTAIPARLDRGEPADVIIVLRQAMDDLIAKGHVMKDSVTDIGVGHIAMAVRTGAAKPDIHTVAAFRKAMLAARSIACTDSAGGNYLRQIVFKRLGIEKEMAAKTVTVSGAPVGPGLARGDYEVGFQQLSELKALPGIEVVGLIPETLQQATVFSAAIATKAKNPKGARDLVRLLASPDAAPVIEASGLEAVHKAR